MSDETKSLPAWRQGWTWTLIKCALATLITSAAATAGLFALLQKLLNDWLGWLPPSWVRGIFEWALRYVWFIGPVVGVITGMVISLGVIAIDAKRGRLSRIK